MPKLALVDTVYTQYQEYEFWNICSKKFQFCKIEPTRGKKLKTCTLGVWVVQIAEWFLLFVLVQPDVVNQGFVLDFSFAHKSHNSLWKEYYFHKKRCANVMSFSDWTVFIKKILVEIQDVLSSEFHRGV